MEILRHPVNTLSGSHYAWSAAEWDDFLALTLFSLIAATLLLDSSLFNKDPLQHIWYEYPQGAKAQEKSSTDINITQVLKDQGKDIIIFYGTQSGTAYELARYLSRTIFQRFSKAALVADISDYNYDCLSTVPSDVIVLFILSTYGEGDPPDNAIRFDEWLDKELPKQQPTRASLANLRFAILGLGNRNYKYYNQFAKKVQNALEKAGGTAIMDLSLADDSNGQTRGDYSEWAAQLQQAFVDRCQIEEQPRPYESALEIVACESFTDNLPTTQPIDLRHRSKLRASASAIYSANIVSITDLTPQAQTKALHIEVDISHLPRVKYNVGDHLLIWPENRAEGVQRLGRILGIDDAEMHRPLEIRSKDSEIKALWPHPITIHTLFKHHLDIAGLASRDMILALKEFADSKTSEAALDEMARNYRRLSLMRRLDLESILLAAAGPRGTWKIPLSFLLENLNPLKPRYYSVSSAPAVSPRKITLTVAMKEVTLSAEESILGLTSRFFLEMQQSLSSSSNARDNAGPLNTSVWCALRKSKFKPPTSNMQPIIMVANGTGIAPFMGFLRHRLRKFEIDGKVGKMLLFYGCKNETTHLYRDEIQRIQSAFGDQLRLVTAYSQKGDGYVQDQVRSYGEETEDLLCDGKANVYMCGSVNMAGSVREELLMIIQKRENWSETQAHEFEGTQLRMRKWQLDVWG
ncbi:hypothetical protein ABOM_001640 [Aspergillus bombycis]|uniref:NADPH--hemoprotein reductase n=1 Tax=Aspergillus bombycis TaxID=109264 RepID=A0A1F8ACW3_9EURO|nr:hypothetical protein ABOM_001640 [Aspergillus bombycis]OGM49542.1 hypothetical protein ABOM_001640 [Aspergillus bombycis]